MHWLGVFRGVEVKQDQLLGWFPDAGGGGGRVNVGCRS